MVSHPKKARPRFFIDPAGLDLDGGKARVDEARLSHQIRNVLRLKVGDQVQLLDGKGNIFDAELSALTRTFIDFHLQNTAQSIETECGGQNFQRFRLTSCLPLIKAHRFEWALEKLSELGAVQIIPFQSARSVVKLKADEEGRNKRWQAICKEAAEQCERLFLPQLAEPVHLQDLLEDLAGKNSGGNRLHLLLNERDGLAPDMVSTLYNHGRAEKVSGSPLEVFVLSGPEGGFTDEEKEMIKASRFLPVTLGSSVLRAETACIIAAGLILAIGSGKD